MLEKIDAFLARHIFHPPVIAYCQATGFTQYRTSRDLFFIGAMLLLLYIGFDFNLMFITMSIVAIIIFLRAALIPQDAPEYSSLYSRLFWFSLMIVELPALLIVDNMFDYMKKLLADITCCFSVFAASIPTIPPKKKRERKRKLAPKRA